MQSLFALLIISGCITAIRTNQCYVCSSLSKDGCGDPFDTNFMNSGNKMDRTADRACMKQKTETKGSTTIVRSMASASVDCIGGINGCKKVKEAGVTVVTCCCTGDKCNKVSTLQQQPMIILCLVMTALILPIYRRI